MKKQIFFGIVTGGFLLSGYVAAAADQLPPWFYERRIHGPSELEPIEKVAGTIRYDRARVVARVEGDDGDGFCTGSRIGPDLFLTNYHCFDYMPCDRIRFHLGYEKAESPKSQLIFTCREVLAKNLKYDYALYRVDFKSTVADMGVTKTYDATHLNLPIPDGDPAGVTQGLNVNQDGDVSGLKVHVKITHPSISDLEIDLISPSGTEVTLFSRQGGEERNLDRMFTFADGLNKFQGEPAQGTWRLVVKDALTGDKGTLDAFDLIVATTPILSHAEGGELTPADFPVATLWNGPITVGEPLMVAGHPGARPKEIDDGVKCKLTTVVPETREGRQTIQHMCDTDGGSSGSPVMDLATGDVVALHWGGIETANLAIPMSLVLADLKATIAPEVYAELNIKP